MRGDFKIDGLAFYDLHRLAAQETGDQEFLHLRWGGDDGGKGCGRIGADGYGNFKPRSLQIAHRYLRHSADRTVGNGDRAAGGLSHCRYPRRSGIGIGSRRCCRAQGFTIVLGGYLLPLPVHAGGLAVVDLHAVHSDVALAGAWVAGDDAGQGDEAASVVRPALEDRKGIEVDVLFDDDLFAAGLFGADGLGECAGERAQLRQHLELVEQAFGSLDVPQAFDALGNFIEPLDAERQRHPSLAAELVDEDLVAGVTFYVFKEQRRTAAFGDAIGDLGDLQLRRDFFADAPEFASFFECFDPVAQIVVGQGFAPVRRWPHLTI